MNGNIFGIERDIVIDELCLSGSELTVQLSYGGSISLTKNQYKVYKQGLLFIPDSSLTVPMETGALAKICFFYRGRGMFFQAESKKVSNGYAFLIPKTLYKQPEETAGRDTGISAKVYCSNKVKNGQYVDAKEDSFYPLFKNNLWCYFPENEVGVCMEDLYSTADLVDGKVSDDVFRMLQYHHKILYLPEHALPEKNYFAYDATLTADDVAIYRNIASLPLTTDVTALPYGAYIPLSETPDSPAHTVVAIDSSMAVTPLEILDSISMLPVCRYLEAPAENSPQDIQGRVMPMKILFINETQIIFGTSQKQMMLQMGSEYPMSIYVPLQAGTREVFVTAAVVRTYGGKRGEACAVCRYKAIREEDRRFLYEKYYGTRFK